jgi:hypothetical protein
LYRKQIALLDALPTHALVDVEMNLTVAIGVALDTYGGDIAAAKEIMTRPLRPREWKEFSILIERALHAGEDVMDMRVRRRIEMEFRSELPIPDSAT